MSGTAATRIAILVLLIASAQAQAPPPPTFTVVSRDGRRPLPTTTLNGQDMVAVEDIAAFFGAKASEDALAGGITLTHRGRTIVASANQNTVSVNGRVVSLPTAVIRAGRRWLVPVEFLQSALGPVHDERIAVRRASRLVVIGDLRVPRITARVESAGPPTRATLDITPAAPAAVTVEAGRVVVRVDADALDLALPTGGEGLIAQFRAGDQPNTVVMMLDAGTGAPRPVVQATDRATRIVVEVPAATAGAAPAAPPSAPAPPTAPAGPPIDPASLLTPRPALQTLVIDPGHGGDDAGVRGASGTLEKQVALDVSHRLRALVESRLGVRVLLTREQDMAATPEARVATANNNKADLFLSLHANAAPAPKTSGAEVYYLRLDVEGQAARDEAARGTVVLPVLGGGTRPIEFIPWSLAQATHVEDSSTFARVVADELATKLAMATTPVRSGPLRLLEGLNMPAILVELGYLTNTAQEKLLASEEHRNLVAQLLFNAVQKFRAHLEARQTP